MKRNKYTDSVCCAISVLYINLPTCLFLVDVFMNLSIRGRTYVCAYVTYPRAYCSEVFERVV